MFIAFSSFSSIDVVVEDNADTDDDMVTVTVSPSESVKAVEAASAGVLAAAAVAAAAAVSGAILVTSGESVPTRPFPVSITILLHVGQTALTRNHLSTHSLWKWCLNPQGSRRRGSPLV